MNSGKYGIMESFKFCTCVTILFIFLYNTKHTLEATGNNHYCNIKRFIPSLLPLPCPTGIITVWIYHEHYRLLMVEVEREFCQCIINIQRNRICILIAYLWYTVWENRLLLKLALNNYLSHLMLHFYIFPDIFKLFLLMIYLFLIYC